MSNKLPRWLFHGEKRESGNGEEVEFKLKTEYGNNYKEISWVERRKKLLCTLTFNLFIWNKVQ